MSKNQCISTLIFDQLLTTLSTKSSILTHYDGKAPKQSIHAFWRRLTLVLQIDPLTQLQALTILWKLTTLHSIISKSLLFKISAVCLLLAQKVVQDESHSVQSLSIVTGISIKQLTGLQVQILTLLDFRLMISSEQRQKMPQQLTRKLNCREFQY